MDGTSKMYQGQQVSVVRDARQGDQPGYNTALADGDQALIKLADGRQKVVAKSDLTEPKK